MTVSFSPCCRVNVAYRAVSLDSWHPLYASLPFGAYTWFFILLLLVTSSGYRYPAHSLKTQARGRLPRATPSDPRSGATEMEKTDNTYSISLLVSFHDWRRGYWWTLPPSARTVREAYSCCRTRKTWMPIHSPLQSPEPRTILFDLCDATDYPSNKN